MTIGEARRIAQEYDDAHRQMKQALARFETAHRAYRDLPLTFAPDPTNHCGCCVPTR